MERLLYISHGNSPKEHLENIRLMLEGGCKWVQLRIKDIPSSELLPIAQKAKDMCEEHASDLTINDDVEVALDVNAWGVHLGLKDKTIKEAKEICGDKLKIGGTVNTIEDIDQRINEQVDYVGLGPLHYTDTKQNLSPILGHEGVQELMTYLKENNYNIPVIVVGGVTEPDIDKLIKSGVYGVGVSSLLKNSHFPKEMIIKLKRDINEAIENS